MRRIPSGFKLLAHSIKVEVVPKSAWKWKDWAYWDSDNLTIYVCRGRASMTRHCFWHEVAHALLEMSGRPDLSGDEAFTDTLGGLLAQMMDTAE